MSTFDDLLGVLSRKGTNTVHWCSEQLGDDQLEILIAAMEISSIPVEHIDLSRNEITSEGAKLLARFLQKSPQVKELGLANNKISDVGAEAFIKVFDALDYPNFLDLEGNPCSKAYVHNLALLAQGKTFTEDIRRGLRTREADELNISGMNYNKLDPRLVNFYVQNVDGLERLILSGCSLGDAGAGAIGALISQSTLTHLDFSDNGISDVGLAQFIESSHLQSHPTISSLSFAKNIRIGNYAAQTLPKTLFEKNGKITFFDLNETSVTSKVRSIINHECELNKQPHSLKQAVVGIRTNNPSCTVVNLQWEEGLEKAAYFISPVLRYSTNLLELNLGNCGFGDKGLGLLAEALRLNFHIRVIAFPNNGITSKGAITLFQCIVQHASLEEVNLAGNRINDEAALSLLNTLRANDKIKNVNVTNNFIGNDYLNEVEGLLLINQSPKIIRKLVVEIESNEPSLKSISLSGGPDEGYYNDASVRLLCQALVLNTTVTSLNLSKNVIADTGAASIAEMLMSNTCITHLNLSDNSISNRGAQRLCAALRTNNALQDLDLSNNAIYDEGVEGFPEMLKYNDRLIRVVLDKTGVTKDMYTKVVEAADLNKEPKCLKDAVYRLQGGDESLRKVDLRRENCPRPLDDASIETLCVHLRGRSFVESLLLQGNKIGTKGCQSLAALLAEEGCGILSLDLSFNPVNDESLQELSKALLSPHIKLDTLKLVGTEVTSAGVNALIEILKTNTSLQQVFTPESVSADVFCAMNRELMVNVQPKSLKPLLARIEANEDIPEVIFKDPEVPFTDSACQLLSASLVKNTHIVSLDLSHNKLTCESMPFLLEALSRSPSIIHVNLSDNRVGVKGGKDLVLFLQEHHHVLTLNLEGNEIPEETVNAINELLSLNAGSIKLKKILLRFRGGKFRDEMINLNGQDETYKLNDNDVRLLCDVLADSPTLRAVDLGLNQITDLGCEMIADLLRRNRKIEALYLDYNPIGEAGGEALYNALKVNHQLHTLFLEGSNVPEEIWEELLGLLHVNETPLKERINMRGLPLDNVDDHTQFKSTDYAAAQEEKVGRDALCLYEDGNKPLLLKS
ncbi:putative paraflagellar rod component [Trypanosoma conorhini]|uniref:Putative paraflagellar rod component n=1 Tax=Trypanosoma conorhini TaxID=83891 RepID=A0A422NDJ6_9TRYP|nr:putative paraflagellar rod component [Trypanosoma conorhini]RNF03568.1 putative paraflagellar rod component [Trypanosoma conorhini]